MSGRIILSILSTFVIAYLFVSFVTLDLNFLHWRQGDRFFAGAIATMMSLVVWLNYNLRA